MADSSEFKALLETEHEWPCTYTFKFIVPEEQKAEVQKLFPKHEIQERKSAKGNFISLTINIEMDSADVVVAIYEQAAKIPKLIAL